MELTNRFIPQGFVTDAIVRAGTTSPAASYSTASYVWLKDGTTAQTVADTIVLAGNPDIQSVYYLASTGGQPQYVRWGSGIDSDVEAGNQYLLNTLLIGHQPSVVAFARSGATLADPTTHWKADHGGNDWATQQVPLIMPGPGICAGVVTNAPAQLDGVAPTLLTDMGVTPSGMEGKVLSDALESPSKLTTAARTSEIRRITPLVAAFVTQHKLETVR